MACILKFKIKFQGVASYDIDDASYKKLLLFLKLSIANDTAFLMLFKVRNVIYQSYYWLLHVSAFPPINGKEHITAERYGFILN